MSVASTNKNNSGVLGPISNGFYAAIIYGILFVPLMLVADKEITVDALGIPALVLFLIINLIEFFMTKGRKKASSQWVILGSFIVSIGTAIVMTVVLN